MGQDLGKGQLPLLVEEPRDHLSGLREMETVRLPNKITRKSDGINTTLKVVKARFQRKLKDNGPLVTQAKRKWLLQKFYFLTRFF